MTKKILVNSCDFDNDNDMCQAFEKVQDNINKTLNGARLIVKANGDFTIYPNIEKALNDLFEGSMNAEIRQEENLIVEVSEGGNFYTTYIIRKLTPVGEEVVKDLLNPLSNITSKYDFEKYMDILNQRLWEKGSESIKIA